ncbi:MAG: FadR/GntR family transcriptional regulator [Pseudomonadota bacterium]
MKIRSDSRSEQVVRLILQEIDSGRLNPGDRLPNHQQLAEKYGVGRSSIREAINALAVMNRVRVLQGSGTFVEAQPDPGKQEPVGIMPGLGNANLYNLMEIREVLECHAVRKAAATISEEDIPMLRDALKLLGKSQSEAHCFLDYDLGFHLAIARAARNPELGEILKVLHDTVNRKLAIIFRTSLTHNIKKAISTAEAIVLYIVQGDGTRAERSMREHLGVPKEAFLTAIFNDPIDPSGTFSHDR